MTLQKMMVRVKSNIKYLLIIILAVQISYLILWNAEKILLHGLVLDDAFYYTKCAENFWQYGFFTLDGEMSTNGFHPLWMIVLLPFTLFINGDTAMYYLSFALFISGYALLIRKLNLGESIFISVLFLNPYFQKIVLGGMETPLLIILIPLWLFYQH